MNKTRKYAIHARNASDKCENAVAICNNCVERCDYAVVECNKCVEI